MMNNIKSPNFPNVPLLTDVGYNGPPSRSWYGIFAPAGTSAAVIHRINTEVGGLLRQPELRDVLARLPVSWEVILIDDGSRDDTFAKSAELHRADAHVRVIRFSRNFGQTAAFAAGFAAARGKRIVTVVPTPSVLSIKSPPPNRSM